MSLSGPYDVVVPISKMGAYHACRKRERKALLEFFEHLARNPFTETEWVVRDSAGRPNYQALVGRFLVTYWSDHAAREVRIVKIARVE